jgi:hypothetical protein
VITSNYTDFSRHELHLKDTDIAYLAGKLTLFETQGKFGLIDLSAKEFVYDERDIVFPFLMTQAPIKPIVEHAQILEYSKAIDFLSKGNKLIVLGYNINSNDDHINSLLYDYLKFGNNRLIFCEYVSEKNRRDYNKCKAIDRIYRRLKMENNNTVEVIPIMEKETSEFFSQLSKIINE